MKNKIGMAVISASLLFSTSCSDAPATADQSSEATISIPHYELVSTGSYGVEMGDSLNMIGSIADCCYHPDGSVLILDRAAMLVRRVNQEEVTLISRAGEGPGEMIFPQSLCCLPDGKILVADEGKREVMEFSTAGDYLGSYFTTDRYVPHLMFPVDSTSIAGAMLDLQMGEGQILFAVNFVRFDENSAPSVVFNRREWEWPAPELYTEIEMMHYTAAPDGTFYLTMDNTEYSVSIYSASGELTGSIQRSDLPRIAKTEEEIEEEIVLFEERAVEDQAYTGGYEPCPYHQMISLVGVDEDSNLWIERLGGDPETEGCLFDVWDSEGNLVHTASFQEPEASSDILFHADQYGILANVVDPDLFPRVLFLELED
ncbi:MAG: hypothetical protein KAS73_13420 [Candidatus Sabulitectum sp.]|nr:hypothetical protein [Candidatus Sabulitectum sp.]